MGGKSVRVTSSSSEDIVEPSHVETHINGPDSGELESDMEMGRIKVRTSVNTREHICKN